MCHSVKHRVSEAASQTRHADESYYDFTDGRLLITPQCPSCGRTILRVPQMLVDYEHQLKPIGLSKMITLMTLEQIRLFVLQPEISPGILYRNIPSLKTIPPPCQARNDVGRGNLASFGNHGIPSVLARDNA